MRQIVFCDFDSTITVEETLSEHQKSYILWNNFLGLTQSFSEIVD